MTPEQEESLDLLVRRWFRILDKSKGEDAFHAAGVIHGIALARRAMVEMPNMQRCTTVGVVAAFPTLFWDFDDTALEEIADYCAEHFPGSAWDIYQSSQKKRHFHLVMKEKSWETAQEHINIIAKAFPHERYMQNCRRQRLRIAPKIDPNGAVVAAAPSLVQCNCWRAGAGVLHVEKRFGKEERYETVERCR